MTLFSSSFHIAQQFPLDQDFLMSCWVKRPYSIVRY